MKIIEKIKQLFKKFKKEDKIKEEKKENKIPEINWYKLVSRNAAKNWKIMQKNLDDFYNEIR